MNHKFVAYLTGLLLGCLMIFVLPKPFTVNEETVRDGIRLSQDTKDGGYPKRIMDSRGKEVYFPVAPQRIISLAPSISEVVIFLEQSHKLIGRTQWDDKNPVLKDVASVGRMDTPDMEAVLMIEADCVLATDLTPVDTIQKLEKLEIPVFVMSFSSLDETLKAMDMIADVTVARERGRELLEDVKARLKPTPENTPEVGDKPRVLFLYSVTELYSAGKKSWVGELIELAGGENVAAVASTPWPKLSAEFVITSQPDIIIALARDAEKAQEVEESVKASPLFKDSPAAENGKIYAVKGDSFTVPGPRMLEALDILQEKISP